MVTEGLPLQLHTSSDTSCCQQIAKHLVRLLLSGFGELLIVCIYC